MIAARKPDPLELVGTAEHAANHADATRPGKTLADKLAVASGVTWLVTHGLASEWPPPTPIKDHLPAPSPGNPRRGLELVGSKDDPPPKPRLITTALADVEPEDVEWLWPGRLPAGRVSLICGRQGKGKSTLVGWLAATVSAGHPWPDSAEEIEPGSVILLQTEESLSQDLRPRLDAMGARVDRIHVVKAVERAGHLSSFQLARDAEALAEAIERIGDVRLVVVDPLGSFVQGISGYNDAEVRCYMQPLFDLAAEREIAVLLIAHPNKDGEKDVLDRVSNSGAFTQMARAVWYYSDDPKDKSRRILSLMKGNIVGMTRTAIAATFQRRRLVWSDTPIHLSAFEIDHAIQKAAREEKIHGKRGPDPSATNRVKEWLVSYLGAKGPQWASSVLDQAEAAGFKESSYRKALRRLIDDDGRVEKFAGDDGKSWLRLVATPPTTGDGATRSATPADEPVALEAFGLDGWADDGGAPGPD